MGSKPNKESTYGNDEQAKADRATVKADEKFRALMLREGHVPRMVTDPSTTQPRFVGHRALPFSRGGSPGAMCADAGSSGGRGQAWARD